MGQRGAHGPSISSEMRTMNLKETFTYYYRGDLDKIRVAFERQCEAHCIAAAQRAWKRHVDGLDNALKPEGTA